MEIYRIISFRWTRHTYQTTSAWKSLALILLSRTLTSPEQNQEREQLKRMACDDLEEAISIIRLGVEESQSTGDEGMPPDETSCSSLTPLSLYLLLVCL